MGRTRRIVPVRRPHGRMFAFSYTVRREVSACDAAARRSADASLTEKGMKQMYKALVLSSVTYAQKAQRILASAGIRSTIMRSAAGTRRQGLRLRAAFTGRAG